MKTNNEVATAPRYGRSSLRGRQGAGAANPSKIGKRIMKKTILNLTLVLGLSVMMTSCYTYTLTVGKGPQTGVEVKKKNHYLYSGSVPVEVSNPKEMAGGAENYEVTITHTFLDGLINALTFGIYAPTTTIVKK